jgi:hypothetical protein
MSDTPCQLDSILEPCVQLALWRRPRPASLAWIDTLDWTEIDDVDADIAGPDWARDICPVLCEAGYPDRDHQQALTSELAMRAEAFAQLMNCDRLRMRLDVIETDACRRFHMDYVSARLLMPLLGSGTQWISASEGEEAAINQLGVGDVAIFKGRLAVEAPAVLHRSPPVSRSGETRLLFILDPR